MISIQEINLKYPINIGAPEAKIICDESDFVLLFYVDLFDTPAITDNPRQRDNSSDTGIAILKFDYLLIHKFGVPNDEVLSGHPYYNLGLQHYTFSIVHDSDWIKEIKRIESHHPRYSEDSFDDLNHYIITFKDSTFECIAKDYSIEYSYDTMKETMNRFIAEYPK